MATFLQGVSPFLKKNMALLILGIVIWFVVYRVFREDEEERERIIKESEEESSFEEFGGLL